jgi:hypothetical protein
MKNIINIDFMFEMAFNKQLPCFYESALYNLESIISNNSTENKINEVSDKIYKIFDVPSFLDIKKIKCDTSFGFKSVVQHNGYCIELKGIESLEGYLENQFSPSSRQLLRSAKKRLELCFDISHKVYYGSIDKDHYGVLFLRFYEMLKLRAHEKGIENRNLNRWDFYTNSVYDMILNKKASLFVIYDGSEPINITLNLHVKNIVFLFITAYNIDYSKFRIGHTNWMILLDWFIKNKISVVDFSKGNIAYKKRWTNREYFFEYHIFYDKSNIINRGKAIWVSKTLLLKQKLRSININTYYYNILRILRGNTENIKQINYQLNNQAFLPEKEQLIPILYREIDDYSFLRRIIYNYLYLSKIHVTQVEIFKELNSVGVFYISSKKEVLKLTII